MKRRKWIFNIFFYLSLLTFYWFTLFSQQFSDRFPNVDSVNSLICILWLPLKMSTRANFGLGLRTQEPQTLHTPAYLQNFTVSPHDPQIWDPLRLTPQLFRCWNPRLPITVKWASDNGGGGTHGLSKSWLLRDECSQLLGRSAQVANSSDLGFWGRSSSPFDL